MTEDSTFTDLLRRVRAGEPRAIEELVQHYEPVIRLEVKLRLVEPRLRRLFDASDICQSVMLSFFVRAAAGQYEVGRPEDLVKLLVGMARNKLAFQARKQRARRRDYRLSEPLERDDLSVASGPSPSRQVAAEELLREFRRRLDTEERELAERRARGLGWADIAAELGGTPEGRRKQLARAADRVAQELGLDEAGAG
jgi:RNA polymerase sigma-70 factor (ECF subfamily)